MRNALFYLLILFSVPIFAQNGITFKVEKLSKPEELLNLHSPNEIYESLILSDMDIEPYEIKEKNIKVPYHIIAKSESPDSLVSFGPNSFFVLTRRTSYSPKIFYHFCRYTEIGRAHV